MRFLRKASYKDIIGENKEHKFHYYDDLPAVYKEFELYLTQKDLDELSVELDPTREDSDQRLEATATPLEKLTRVLRKNGAVISAIHCPESVFNTCNEIEGEPSSNYLSLCEIIKDKKSEEKFKKLIEIADKICQKQIQRDPSSDLSDEENDEENNKKNDEENQIIVIIHEGCEKGCIDNEDEKSGTFCQNIEKKIVEIVKDMEVSSLIQIALENITPFYSDKIKKSGNNCGWNSDNQICKKNFFDSINEKLKPTDKDARSMDKGIQFCACVDFCHIMVSEKIKNQNADVDMTKVIEEYFEKIDYKKWIKLFHLSNYGKDFSHGQLFSLEDEKDKKVLEKTKVLCEEIGKCGKDEKDIPITFEMADGADAEKAKLNYEHIMYYFSNKHIYGKFGELLTYKNNKKMEVNKELKDFFDALFLVYTSDKKSVFEITNALYKVKQFVMKNTKITKKNQFFGFDFDKTEINLSLARLKAYIYYTRFCNLGNYLADNHYSGENCIWDEKEQIATDFGLAMKYFMFNDEIEQCVYTGIKYRFLIDFLPRKENFVRFNDGIEKIRKLEIKREQKVRKKEETWFDEVRDKISGHISGFSIKDNEADFYSVGKNFGQCLFKYFNSEKSEKSGWSFQLYEKQPVNYVDYVEKVNSVDYVKKRCSIQAFTQLILQGKEIEKEIELSLDISRFSSGRDGKTKDTLEGFLKEKSFVKENVASISDEEILFTKLPTECEKFSLTKEQGVILKKIFLELKWRKSGEQCKLEYKKDDENIMKEINDINTNPNSILWEALDRIWKQYSESELLPELVQTDYSKTIEKLKELNLYDNKSDDKAFYKSEEGNIECIWEEKDER